MLAPDWSRCSRSVNAASTPSRAWRCGRSSAGCTSSSRPRPRTPAPATSSASYQAAIETEAAVANRDRWADGRTFAFDRELPASPDVVWQHWVDPALLATWWAPPSFTVSRCALVPRRGGRALLEYQDADGHTYLSEGRVRAAKKPERLEFDLSVLDDAGAVMLTGRYDVRLTETPGGTRLHLGLSITDTTVEAVPAIAGIEAGWGQVLDQLVTAVSTPRRASRRTKPARSKKTDRKEARS